MSELMTDRAAAVQPPCSPWQKLLASDGWLVALILVFYLRVPDALYDTIGINWLTEALTVGALGLVVARGWWVNIWPRGWFTLACLLAVYGGVMIASMLLAPDELATFHMVVRSGSHATLAIVVVMLVHRRQSLRAAVWALVAASIFMGSIGAYQTYTGNYDNALFFMGTHTIGHIDGKVDGPRLAGPYRDPNFYAQFLVLLVPLAIDRLWARHRWPLLLPAAWALFVLAIGMMYTYSRGGMVATFVVIVAMTILAFVRRPAKINLALTLAVCLAALVCMPDLYLNRVGSFARFLPSSEVDESPDVPEQADAPTADPAEDDDAPTVREKIVTEYGFRGRLSEMIVGLQMFRDRPVIGMGFGTYRDRYLGYARPLGIDKRNTPRHAHCLYLEIAAETGIIGLAVFCSILLFTFHRLRQAYRSFRMSGLDEYAHLVAAIGVGLLGFLTAAIFLHAAFMHGFWVVIGLAVASGAIAKSEKGVHAA